MSHRRQSISVDLFLDLVFKTARRSQGSTGKHPEAMDILEPHYRSGGLCRDDYAWNLPTASSAGRVEISLRTTATHGYQLVYGLP